MSRNAMRLLLIVAFFLAWELAPRVFDISPLLLPPLSTSIVAGLAVGDVFLQAFLVTLKESVLAVFIACSSGVVAGMLIGMTRLGSQALIPIASMLYAVPVIVLYPMFTVWLGIGQESKVAFGAFYGFFPTLLATAAGISTIPFQHRVVGRSFGATRFQEIIYILLPATVPPVLAGIRLGGALAIVGVVAAEMLTATEGLGFQISHFRTMVETPRVFFSILLVIVLVIGFEVVMAFVEALSLRWRPAVADPAAEAEPVQARLA